jgi:hypothetical protein
MFTRALFSPFAAMAALGLLLSLLVHIRALAGHHSLFGRGDILVLSGFFIVFIPAVIVVRRRTLGLPYMEQADAAYEPCPKWIRIALGVIGANAAVWIVYTFIAQPPTRIEGPIPANVLCPFSAIAMAFYAMSLAFLFPVVRNGKLWRQIRCPDGHRLSSLATRCPFCGKAVVPDSSEGP